ncbi:Aminodeoxychorismate synthase component 1 [Allorhodopirellula solitaria]|uniref:Aminodeoxychorismate synthase component 1 n=2 Tax=Allorhodopirellula solitaria TaxID=2527987 RepID=A0A5C5XU10_9BACT|nr:Aminodeoxychorismate synthase component 1 [Allorhodopirellula solitaria]
MAQQVIPVVRQLDQDHKTDLVKLFRRLRHLPYCVWLDSASDHQHDRGRYSFLTADPVAWCRADMTSPDPWPLLRQWCRGLQHRPLDTQTLPPFCGGLVGMIAYEAAWWLEPALRPPPEQVPPEIPGMALGLYDWTIAVDHRLEQVWLLSTGLSETFEIDRERATKRADQVMGWIAADPCEPDSAAPPNPHSSAGVTSNFTDEQFARSVAEIIEGIREGDTFQVNLAQTLTRRATCPAKSLYERLRLVNPAPYAAYFDCGAYQVLSSSPEGFLQVRIEEGQRVVVTRPIKGTVRRTGDKSEDARLGGELLASEKDRAENIMIVDLMRNDLSRVCEDQSVEVTGLCELESYQRVQHLVSTVRGVLCPDSDMTDLLAACFPGGSITGAPKVEAMRTIARLEKRPRGAYCGSLGYVSLSGAADFNILIRTVTERLREDGSAAWEFPVGGGITARSDPQEETEETWVKAASLLEAIEAAG